ncbi:MAG: PAS domain S-box protein [Magnetococcales bacterium]|nr:PAS domain S-box protein [Magnetococcales bacterium]
MLSFKNKSNGYTPSDDQQGADSNLLLSKGEANLFQLLRYFSITSLITMLLGGILINIHFNKIEERSLMQMGEHQNIAMTKAFSNSLWPSLRGFLKKTVELDKNQIKDHTMMIPYLDTMLGRLMQDLMVVKIKIFNIHGITVYSTQSSQIGEDQSKNVGFISAMQGKAVSNLVHRNGFPSFDGVVEDRDMISTYVPLRKNGKIQGVFELYYDITIQLSHHEQSQKEIAFGVISLFSILYLALFSIIRKADSTIKIQHGQLTSLVKKIRNYNETLEQKVEDRTETLKITNAVLKTEIEERQQAEGELLKLTQAVEQSPATVMITDLEGNIEYVNPKFSQVTGYSRAEVIRKKPSILKSGKANSVTYEKMWYEISSGREWRGEFHNRRKDGSLFWESASISPIRNKYGKITHYVAVKEDITEFKAAQDSLKNSEMRLRTILDSVGEGIVGVKESGEIESCNPAMVRIFGYTADELIGENVRILTPEPHRTAHDNYIKKFLATTKPGDSLKREGLACKKDGSLLPIELGIIQIQTNSDIRFIATVHDISERKKAEKDIALSRITQAHHEKMASLGTLAAGILHEINNPTAAISGLLEAIQDNLGEENEDTLSYLKMMDEQISRISNITRDVSDLAAPQLEEIQLVDINSLAEKTSNLMRFDKRLQTIELSLDLDRTLPAISASASQLRQVLINLIINAADAMEENGDRPPKVSIKTSKTGDDVNAFLKISVTDNGIGMESDVMDKVMDPFFTTKPAGKGTGLGLSLCYSIIDKHDGTIEIESTSGKGSTVDIVLPLTNSNLKEI